MYRRRITGSNNILLTEKEKEKKKKKKKKVLTFRGRIQRRIIGRIQSSTTSCHDQIGSFSVVRRTTKIVQGQITGQHDSIQVGLDNPQVGLGGYIIAIVNSTGTGTGTGTIDYSLRLSKEVGLLDDPCISEHKVHSGMPLENGVESRGKVAIHGDIGPVERRVRMQVFVLGGLDPPVWVDVEEMDVP